MKNLSISLLTLAISGVAAFAQAPTQLVENAKDVVAEAKSLTAPDARQVVYEIEVTTNTDGKVVVGGATSEQSAHDTLVEKLNTAGIDFIDNVVVMPYNKWAQTRLSAASHRVSGRHAAEMATQSVMGTPLRVLDDSEDWWRVQTPDGYIAYVPSSSVIAKTDEEMAAWRAANRYIVTSLYQIRVYNSETAEGPRDVVTDLVNGCIVVAVEPGISNGRRHVELPDGRTGYVDATKIAPIEEWAAQDFDADRILNTAYSMEGTPYLWGGTSVKALDCSGLAKVSYYSNAIILMRDASQQALTGMRIEAADWRTCEAGDLLFFGNAKTKKVTHVAIYDNNGNYVHSSGRVKRNSVDPESPDYLSTPFLHAVRINGNEGTTGIVSARNHPWYFTK
ncbi:MAG: C40 family peptidase [Muribaculaceae bacterium]|nr:C40 family peptidase [Muribaculaceae bacterium]